MMRISEGHQVTAERALTAESESLITVLTDPRAMPNDAHTYLGRHLRDALVRIEAAAIAQERERLTADAFARAFMRIRGAHNGPDGPGESGEPCAWCRLAGEQAAEAARLLAPDPVR